jgi:hypothetical protein
MIQKEKGIFSLIKKSSIRWKNENLSNDHLNLLIFTNIFNLN